MKSINDFNWKIQNQSIPKNTKETISILLKNRNLKDKKEVERFFNPPDPSQINLASVGLSVQRIKPVIQRIKLAKTKKQKVIIYGDYDADGVCATAILWETLYGVGIDCMPHIPNRFDEGYGLNPSSIEKLKQRDKNLSLIITVDNGIVAYEGVEKAKNLGIDVIITDHHQSEKKLPSTNHIVHSTKVSGSAIAWFLSREIIKQIDKEIPNKYESSLDLCAIGTIADQIPLTGVNRSIVTHGLKVLTKTKRLGLVELFKSSGIKSKDGVIDPVSSYQVGFMIAPRINAMGRIKDANDSLALLCTHNPSRAKVLAQKLEKTNKKRQSIVEKVVNHALIISRKNPQNGAIVIAHKDYHEGVIGLAASKLVEEFNRPAIVISKEKDLSKASARSIAGIDIIKEIKKFEKLIVSGGGHPMAAGFTIKTKHIKKFSQLFNSHIKKLLNKDLIKKRIKVDCNLPFEKITWSLIESIEKFEPFGIGNPRPIFAVNDLPIQDLRLIGNEKKHIKIKIGTPPKTLDCLGFSMASSFQRLTASKNISVCCNLSINNWNSHQSMQLIAKDFKIQQ